MQVTFQDKVTGGTLSAANVNELKAAINANDQTGVGGAGVTFAMQGTAPANDTIWIDTASAANQAYPIRNYINGTWTPVTDEGLWWDTIGGVISRGKPIGILFSGQSNVEYPLYYPADADNYTGDITLDKHVTYWNTAANSGAGLFQVYQFGSAQYPLGGDGQLGAGNITTFAKQLARHTGRSIRLVGTRHGGQTLVNWENGNAYWTELVAEANSSGIDFFDTFIWVHGEANYWQTNDPVAQFSGYDESFKNFISRIRSQSWANNKTKIIVPSHGLAHELVVLNANDADFTFRGLEYDNDPFSGWVPFPFPKVAKLNEQHQATTDVYHYTTREQERMGHLFFKKWLELPNYNKMGATKFATTLAKVHVGPTLSLSPNSTFELEGSISEGGISYHEAGVGQTLQVAMDDTKFTYQAEPFNGNVVFTLPNATADIIGRKYEVFCNGLNSHFVHVKTGNDSQIIRTTAGQNNSSSPFSLTQHTKPYYFKCIGVNVWLQS